MTGTWLTPADIAELQPRPVSDRAIRLRVENGQYGQEGQGWRRTLVGRNGNALQISAAALSAPEKLAWLKRHPHLQARATAIVAASTDLVIEPPLERKSFDEADDNLKARALEREQIVVACRAFVAANREGLGLTRAKEAFCAEYLAAHPDRDSLSVDSVDRWTRAYEAHQRNGLVDRNDGSARRGKGAIPQDVRNFFRELLKFGDAPSIAHAITDTRYWALDAGIDITDIADDAYYRFAHTIPEPELRATGVEQDAPERFMPSTRRDYTLLRSMAVVQADHHLSDVFVRCNDESCSRGHRVWLTVFIDVASRMVLSWTGSLDYPNSETILRTFRALVTEYGLPEAVYVDNGADYKKAFGKARRAGGASPLPEAYLSNLVTALGVRTIFATPYRAQSKTIERTFGTFVRRIWSGSAAYVGQLGKRTERVTRLFETPHLLPSVDEFRAQLASEIALYNTDARHRGHGMAGRSPMQTFASKRLPPKTAPGQALRLAFWTYHVRMVRGSAFTAGERYRLSSERVGFDYEGKYVQVLVNPDDLRQAIVLSGCEHLRRGVAREKTACCGCSGKGAYLCDATLWERSTFDFDDAITRENTQVVRRLEKFWRRRIAEGDPLARQRVEQFKRRRPEILKKIAALRHAEQHPLLVASGEGGSTAILPRHSRLVRQIQETTQLLDATPVSLPPIDEEALDALLDETPRGRHLVAVEDDPEHVQERERIRRERKVRAGLCSLRTCDEPLTGAVDRAEYCGRHLIETLGSDCEPSVRQRLIEIIKEEMEWS